MEGGKRSRGGGQAAHSRARAGILPPALATGVITSDFAFLTCEEWGVRKLEGLL